MRYKLNNNWHRDEGRGRMPLSVILKSAIASISSAITLTFNTAMASPIGKETEFSASIGGGSGGDYQEWETVSTANVSLTTFPYQFVTKRISDNQWKVSYKTEARIHLDEYYEVEKEYIFDIEKMEVSCK